MQYVRVCICMYVCMYVWMKSEISIVEKQKYGMMEFWVCNMYV